MQVIDRDYQVLKALGQGLAGEVFLVKKGDQLLALKLLKPVIANLSPQEAATHFKAEFAILKQLSHPHIARIVDFGTDAESGRHYFTSEYVEGRDLFTETRNTPLNELEDLFIQGLRALEYLLAHGVFHFDLKPENLLLHETKRIVKLIDFGLAGFRPRGQLAGTPAYMAPEVILGNRPDGRADLYSFGVTCYECATGSNPFRATTLAETLRRQEQLQAVPAHQVNAKISPALSELLAMLMRKNPADRPATAGAALRILGRLMGKKITLETEATRLSYLPNETQLIGREAELKTFRAALQEVQHAPADQPFWRGVVVVGEAGLGKTRLLQEFRFHAQLAGMRAAGVEGDEFPEVSGRTCFLLDDLADASLAKLRLQSLSTPHPILLVAASTVEPPHGAGTRIIPLKPFALQDIEQYLAALTGLSEAPAALARELLERSQGSPQFLTEILSELIRAGSLLDEHGRWTAANLEDFGVDFRGAKASEKLEANFAKEFGGLDQPAREVLQWAALAPQGVGADLLQAASSVEDLPYWVLELTGRGFLVRDEPRQSFRLTNPLMVDWILRQISEKEKEKRHARFAEALKKYPTLASERRYHLGRSGKGPEARAALLDLARELDRKGRFREALENVRLAGEFPKQSLEDLTEVQLKIGEELISLKDFAEAEAHFDRLHEKLMKLPDGETSLKLKERTLAKLGANYLLWNALQKAEDCFRAGLQLLEAAEPEDRWRRLNFENYLGRIHLQRGEAEQALEIFTRTKEEEKKLKPEQRRLVVTNDRGMALVALSRPAEAFAQFEDDLELYRGLQNEPMQVKAHYNLGDAAFALKDFDRTIKEYKRCAELSKGQKNFDMLLRAYHGLGNVYQLRHDYGESQEHYERALAIAQKIGDLVAQAGIEINLAVVHNLCNRPAKALPHLKMVVTLLGGMESPGYLEKFYLTNAHLELGDVYRRMLQFADAERHLNEAKKMAAADKNLGSLLFSIEATRAKLRFDEGKADEAKKIHAALAAQPRTEDEKIELAKLENLLSGTPLPAEREPAVTQNALEYTRPSESTLYLSQAGEGGYAKLLELTRFINAETNLDYVLRSVLQYALELSGAERGMILLLDDNGRLETRASINTAANPNLTEISSRVAEQALQSGEILETDDATQDERFNEYQSVMILKLRSILCIPIRSRNKTVGVLYLDHRYRPGAFARARLPILTAFCDQAGIAIENARLFEKYEQAQVDLKKRLEVAREEAEHYHELLGENVGSPPTRYAYDNIIAKSKPMYEVFKTLDKITETNISVFINGETGTGKELIAKALHYNNPERCKNRFVAINCGGIPPNLIESELFGYKAGAFTGATKDKKGLFAEADGGTLFMDEVADLELALQVKLLRALEEGEVIPVGDTRPIRFSLRVVSASHKNLSDLIREGKFREDLYYRICQIRIPLPPLRERPEDIPPLVDKFAKDYAEEHSWKKPPKLSASLMKKLIEYDWPGNVRELENTIRVSCALSDKGELTVKHLPENFGVRLGSAPQRREGPRMETERETRPADNGGIEIDEHNRLDTRRTWEDYEKLIFAKAYQAADSKPLEAAKLLDVSPATFYKRIKDFDLANKANALFNDPFVLVGDKTLRQYLEDIFWAAYQASGQKAYTAIKWLDVSQGHFYNVLKSAKKRHA